MAHLADPPAQPVHVFGVLPLVQGVAALHFPDRLRGQVGEQVAHQAALGPLIAEQPAHVLVHRIADPGCIGIAGKAGELGHVVIHGFVAWTVVLGR